LDCAKCLQNLLSVLLDGVKKQLDQLNQKVALFFKNKLIQNWKVIQHEQNKKIC